MTGGQTSVGQTAPEQPVAQPTAAPMMLRVAEDPAREGTDISAPIRDDVTAGTPPPSSVAKEENRAPSPAWVEEPPVEASAQEGAPDHGKGPMMPSNVVGRSAECEGTQAVSDNEVAEI